MGVTGAILCGGASKRMGTPKAELMMPDGRTMIEAVRDTLQTICTTIVCVGQPGLTGHQTITDEKPGSGPLAGIEALLRSGCGDRYLIVPCDMPALDPQSLHCLIATEHDGLVHFAGQPLPCIAPASLAQPTSQLLADGIRALHEWQVKMGAQQLNTGGHQFIDADTPEEFNQLCERIRRPQ